MCIYVVFLPRILLTRHQSNLLLDRPPCQRVTQLIHVSLQHLYFLPVNETVRGTISSVIILHIGPWHEKCTRGLIMAVVAINVKAASCCCCGGAWLNSSWQARCRSGGASYHRHSRPSFCLSVRLCHGGSPWTDIFEMLYLILLSIYRENPNLSAVGQKYGAPYMNSWLRFIVAGDTKSP